MTVNKVLSAFGELIKRSVQLVFKLCGVFLSLCWHAFLADTPKRDKSGECPSDKELREHYEHAAAHDFKDGWGC